MRILTYLLLSTLAHSLYSQSLRKAIIPVVPPIYRIMHKNHTINAILVIDNSGTVKSIRLNDKNQSERDYKFALSVFTKWSFAPDNPGTIPFTIEIKIIPTDQRILPDTEIEPNGKLRLFAWQPEITNDPVIRK